MTRSIWLLGDQLDRSGAVLREAAPNTTTVLFVESEAKLSQKRWHRQRLHLVLTSMRRFAHALREEGFDVDYRKALTLAAGVRAHLEERRPAELLVEEPASWDARHVAGELGARVVRSERFLCHYEEFAEWAGGRSRVVLEHFYRWQRKRHGYLMDGDEPAGGRWNFDAENREPPPRDPVDWPRPPLAELDAVDRDVLAALPETAWGDDPSGLWPTTREHALALLAHFVEDVLPGFGPYEDAMLADEWRLRHSLLSPALNLGLIHPREVCDAVEAAYRRGHVPIASAEGFLRQVLGWREFVWGMYWAGGPSYRDVNLLGAAAPLPPLYAGAATRMRCVERTRRGIEERAWAHHIQRLMVLGNLALLAGVRPSELVEWMWASFVDGAEWVMVPNVIGMALHADGGRMATKPYAAGGAYIDRMSDYCRTCDFDRKRRVGDDACPFTTLYWDFLDRNRSALAANHRLARQLASLDRLGDLAAVRERAAVVRGLLAAGDL